jgi:hypothetical protein
LAGHERPYHPTLINKTTSSKDRTVITRQDLSVIREKINEALEAIASEYDAKMTIGNMSYGGSSENVTNFTTKITCEVGDYADPVLQWKMEHHLGVSDTTKVFNYKGNDYQFVAFKNRAKRYPFVYKNVATGEMRKCAISYAQMIAGTESK